MTELLVRKYWLSGPFFRQTGGAIGGAAGEPIADPAALTNAPPAGDPPTAPGTAPAPLPASGEPGSLTPGQSDDGNLSKEQLLQKNRELETQLEEWKASSGKQGRELGDLRLVKRRFAGETLTPEELKRVDEIKGLPSLPITPVAPVYPTAPGVVPSGISPVPTAPDPRIAQLEAEVKALRQGLGNVVETTTDYYAEQRIAKEFSPEERKSYQPGIHKTTQGMIAGSESMEELLLHRERSRNMPLIIATAEKNAVANYFKALQNKTNEGIPTSGGIQPTIPGASGNVKLVPTERLLRLTDPVAANALYGEEKKPAPAAPPAT